MKIPQLSKNERVLFNRIAKAIAPGTLFLVGGTVRDLLLHRPTRDLDVVICGVPLKKIERILKPFGKIHRIGERFGVLRLNPKNSELHIDIALPRTEQGKGTGGYRDFSFRPDPRLSIEADLSRRDFTVNAMALSWPKKELIDPYGGRGDLTHKILRTVGDPNDRFNEDYSRILRLFRFSVSLQFSIEKKTGEAARRLAPRLTAKRNGTYIVPREVIAEQFIRTFVAQPAVAFDLYDRYGIFAALVPEVTALRGCRQPEHFHHEGDVFAHTRRALENLASPKFEKAFPKSSPSPLVLLATLLHDIGKPKTKRIFHHKHDQRIHFWGHDRVGARMASIIAERLRLSSYHGLVEARALAWMIRHHLVVTTNDVRVMRAATLAKYFADPHGRELLQLVWADQSASLRPSGKPALEGFHATRKRLAKLFGSHTKPTLPKPLLTGTDIIQVLHLTEGPRIGQLLRTLREAQLENRITTKTEAWTFLRRQGEHNG